MLCTCFFNELRFGKKPEKICGHFENMLVATSHVEPGFNTSDTKWSCFPQTKTLNPIIPTALRADLYYEEVPVLIANMHQNSKALQACMPALP